MLAFTLLPVLGLVLQPAAVPVASPRAAVKMMANPVQLGYQTEAAGAETFVRQMEFSDEVMLLRVAARRANEEKGLESQRTLMLQCEKVQLQIQKQLAALEEQQAELKSLARVVDSVMRTGDKVISSDFSAALSELQRKLD